MYCFIFVFFILRSLWDLPPPLFAVLCLASQVIEGSGGIADIVSYAWRMLNDLRYGHSATVTFCMYLSPYLPDLVLHCVMAVRGATSELLL